MADIPPKPNQAADAGIHHPGADGKPLDFLAVYRAELKARQTGDQTATGTQTNSDTGPPTRRVEARGEVQRTGAATDAVVGGNPYKKLEIADNAANEIRSFAGKKPTDTITVTENGKPVTMTVAARTAELQQIIQQQGREAIAEADRIIQTGHASPAAQRAAVEPTRQDLATRTGYGVNADIDMKDLIKRLDNPNLSPDLRRDLEDLKTVQTKSNEMMSMQHAQEVTRLLNAKFRSEGLLDPADASGNFKASADSTIEAFQLIREASRLGVDGALSSTPDFQQLSQTVNTQFGALQTKTFQSISDDITRADALKAKNPDLADAIFDKAVHAADKIDIAYIASILPTQNDPDVRKQLLTMIQTTENARVDYATFLNGRGDYAKALPLLTRAQAEAGPLFANDPSFFQQMNKALYGAGGVDTSVSPTDYYRKIMDACQHQKYDEALGDLTKMRALAQSQLQAQKDVPKITEEKARVDKALAAMGKDSDDDQYAATQRKVLMAEQAQLGNQLIMAAQAQYTYHFTDLIEGEINRQMGGGDHNKTAQNAYARFAAEEPDAAKQMNVAQLQKAVEDHSFFSMEGLKEFGCAAVATGIGIGTGIGAAALTAWGGPLAGVTGIAAGTAAGSVTYALLKKYALGEDISARTFIEGAGYTLGGVAMYYTAGASAEVQGGGRIAQFALTRLAPVMANATIVNGTQMGTAMYYDKQDFKHAAMDFGTREAMDSMLAFVPAPKFAKSFTAPAVRAFMEGLESTAEKRSFGSTLGTTARGLGPMALRANWEYNVVRGPGGSAVISSALGTARPYLQEIPQLRPVVGDPNAERAQRTNESPLPSELPDGAPNQ